MSDVARAAEPARDASTGADSRLADLRALTDTGLTRLDVDDLLEELLSRVRLILDADTAAVLLLDERSGDLVARAAQGIEEEVRQGVHVPFGMGFAGRVAATRGAVRLDRVDSTTVTNPILWEKGIRVMLGVPLLAGARVLGVLHVGRLANRSFTPRDAELLQVVADRVAGAVEARQSAIEQAAGSLLERSLVPGALPRCDGLELTARYVPARRGVVGGDWYDVFRGVLGELWVVIGDVAGHGLEAAVVMGRIRSAVRAYTILGVPPERVLELVDREVRHFEIGTIVTLLVGVTYPPFDLLRISVAGHLPPVRACSGRPGAVVDVPGGPPLGVPGEVRRVSTDLAIESGEVLAFFTDGLIERRGESLDDGLERLCRSVSSRPAEQVARDVMRSMVGESSPDDDIALVVMRRTSDAPTRDWICSDGNGGVTRSADLRRGIVIEADLAETELANSATAPATARAFVRATLGVWHAQALCETAELLVSELVTNVVRHVGTPLVLAVTRRATSVRFSVDDPSRILPARLQPSHENERGRGMLLVDALADRWGVELQNDGKTIWFELELGEPAVPEPAVPGTVTVSA